MPNPFLSNVDFDASASISVQNRRDETGAIATYLILKPGVANNFQMRKANLDDTNAEVVFKLINQSSLINLTSSLSVAYQNRTSTGSF
jgi:hypothetical protein